MIGFLGFAMRFGHLFMLSKRVLLPNENLGRWAIPTGCSRVKTAILVAALRITRKMPFVKGGFGVEEPFRR
jgi:hypothetical protein